jgi:hypothetical protein
MSEKIKASVRFSALQAASEVFGERIPDTWNEMTEYQRDKWLFENRHSQYDGMEAGKYSELIESHAQCIDYEFKVMLKKLINSSEAETIIEGQSANLALDLKNLNEVSKEDHSAVFKQFNSTQNLNFKGETITPPQLMQDWDEDDILCQLGDSQNTISEAFKDLLELL